MPNPFVITSSVSPVVAEYLAANRRKAHHYVLSAFPRGLSSTPRADAGILWHLDHNQLVVQYQLKPDRPELLGAVSQPWETPMPVGAETVQVAISLNCQKTPPSDIPEDLRGTLKQSPKSSGGKAYRSRLVTVPEEDRVAWAIRKLSGAGLALSVPTVKVGKLKSISLDGKHPNIPYVDIAARAVVTEPALLHTKIRDGLGKGKNYGLGMLRVTPQQATAHIPPSPSPNQ